jgi:hypothetical protein
MTLALGSPAAHQTGAEDGVTISHQAYQPDV